MLYRTRTYADNTSDTKMFYYLLNLQGDVIKLVDRYSCVCAGYTYDAWGNILSSSGSMASVNPLRYRGYYYDTETGFYYLQSRYYDPVLKRFINADSYASTGQGFIGYNMFAYCGNSPVNANDPAGYFNNSYNDWNYSCTDGRENRYKETTLRSVLHYTNRDPDVADPIDSGTGESDGRTYKYTTVVQCPKSKLQKAKIEILFYGMESPISHVTGADAYGIYYDGHLFQYGHTIKTNCVDYVVYYTITYVPKQRTYCEEYCNAIADFNGAYVGVFDNAGQLGLGILPPGQIDPWIAMIR